MTSEAPAEPIGRTAAELDQQFVIEIPGTPIGDVAELAERASGLLDVLELGHSLRDRAGRTIARAAAARFGRVDAPPGHLLVSSIGPLSRVSAMVEDDQEEIWRPQPVVSEGLVLGTHLTPLDHVVIMSDSNGEGYLHWNFSTAALALVRCESLDGQPHLHRIHARAHLGRGALRCDRITVLPIGDVAQHQAALHPLSQGTGQANPSQFVA